jgi:hypothetical protein
MGFEKAEGGSHCRFFPVVSALSRKIERADEDKIIAEFNMGFTLHFIWFALCRNRAPLPRPRTPQDLYRRENAICTLHNRI